MQVTSPSQSCCDNPTCPSNKKTQPAAQVSDTPFQTRGKWIAGAKAGEGFYVPDKFDMSSEVDKFHQALEGPPKKASFFAKVGHWVQDFGLGLIGFAKGLFSFKLA